MNRPIAVIGMAACLGHCLASANAENSPGMPSLEAAVERAQNLVTTPPAPWAGSEPVSGIAVDIQYRCVGGEYRYAVAQDATSRGPALAAEGARFNAGYLYPSEAGYRVQMDGETAGAAVSLAGKNGQPVLPLGAALPLGGQCVEGTRGYSAVSLALDPSVKAELETKPRTGALRPICYKNITTGFYVQELWKTLRLSWRQARIEMKVSDSQVFHNREACVEFYRWLSGS